MKIFVLAGLVLALVATPAFGQTALPVCKRPVTLPEAVRAVRTNDRSILNADCMKLVEAFNATYKMQEDERPKTCQGLADMMEKRWIVEDAPMGVDANFTRIMPDGRIDLYGFSRPVRPREQWTYDNQLGLWTMSLQCCNFPTNDALPFVRQEPVHVSAPEPMPPIREQAMDPRLVEREGDDEIRRPYEERQAPAPPAPNYSWYNPKGKTGKLVWFVGAPLLAGGLYCGITGDCFSQETIVVNRFR